MRLLKTIIAIAAVLFILPMKAQVPLQFSQVFKTLEFVNPAYSAFESQFTSKLLFRSEKSGMEGHPTTSGFTFYSPLKNYKLGMGGTLLNYNHGSWVKGNASAVFNVDLRVNRRDNLAFGFQVGAEYGYLDWDKAITYNEIPFDQSLYGDIGYGYADLQQEHFVSPTFGVGFIYYSDLFYAGASSFLTMNNDPDNDLPLEFYQGTYLMAGFTQKLSREWFMKETILTKLMNNNEHTYEVGVNVAYRDLLWFGTAHRWKDAQIFLVDMKVTRQFRIGVSYDAQLSALKRFSYGSFEVRLEYRSVIRRRGVDKSRTFYNLN